MTIEHRKVHHFQMVVTGGHLFDFLVENFTQELFNGKPCLVFGPSMEAGTVVGKRVPIEDIIFLKAVDEEIEVEVPDVVDPSANMEYMTFDLSDVGEQGNEAN